MNQQRDLRGLSRGQIRLFSCQQCSDKRITETPIHRSGLTQLRQTLKIQFQTGVFRAFLCLKTRVCVCEVIEPWRTQLAAEADGRVIRPKRPTGQLTCLHVAPAAAAAPPHRECSLPQAAAT